MENSNPNSSRGNDFIIDVSDMAEIRINYEENPISNNINTQYNQEYNEWKIGQKYLKKLSLTEDQCTLLNRLSFNNNVFNEIDYCRVQILKQFMRTIEFLDSDCKPVNRAYSSVIDELTEIIIVLEFNYRKDSLNYKYTFESIQSEILNHLLKLCENNVRDVYSIKRKISTDFKYTKPTILEKFHKKIVSKAEIFLESNRHQILDADYRTNIILNENNTNRWKEKFDLIVSDYSNAISFEREVERLAEVNIKNPSLDTIYFDASKFISTHDKIVSLKLYLRYLEKDLHSNRFDRKHLTKTIQKNLFSTKEQIEDFEKIVNEFVITRDLQSAFQKIANIYLPKRKKIVIDRSAIDRVQRLDSETSQKLGDLLADEETQEEELTVIEFEENLNIELHVLNPSLENEILKYSQNLGLSEIQMNVLDFFERNSFSILQSELEDYMRSKQLFMGATLEAINDTLYDTLDDLLIEEEDEYFTINQEYFKKLLNNDQ